MDDGRGAGRRPAALLETASRLGPLARLPQQLIIIVIPWSVLSTAFLHSLYSVLGLAVALGLAAIVSFSTGSFRLQKSHVWISVICVMALTSYFFPQVRLESSNLPLQGITWMVVGLVVAAVSISSPARPALLARVVLLTGTAAAVIAQAQGQTLGGRLQGLQLNPNYLAVYLAPAIVISLALSLRHRNIFWLGPGLVCLPVLLSSQSREGVLAVVAGVAFVCVQGRPPIQKAMIALTFLIVVAAFPGDLGEISSLGAGDRSAAELSTDNYVRARVASFAVHVALAHPLRGIGFGQFPAYAAASSAYGLYITTTNEYLLLPAETGLISLIALLVLLCRALKNPRPDEMSVIRVAVFVCAVSMLFIDSFSSPVLAIPFWACLGTLLARSDTKSSSVLDTNALVSASRRGIVPWPTPVPKLLRGPDSRSAPTGSRLPRLSTNRGSVRHAAR
jgi:hypothetical protein